MGSRPLGRRSWMMGLGVLEGALRGIGWTSSRNGKNVVRSDEWVAGAWVLLRDASCSGVGLALLVLPDFSPRTALLLPGNLSTALWDSSLRVYRLLLALCSAQLDLDSTTLLLSQLPVCQGAAQYPFYSGGTSTNEICSSPSTLREGILSPSLATSLHAPSTNLLPKSLLVVRRADPPSCSQYGMGKREDAVWRNCVRRTSIEQTAGGDRTCGGPRHSTCVQLADAIAASPKPSKQH